MSKIVLGEALRALLSINDAIIAAYRESSHGLPPGPVPNLASSMTEQRRELAKVLAEIAALPASRSEIEVGSIADFVSSPSGKAAPTAAKEAFGLLGLMKAAEDAEYERLSELAGSVLAVSAQAADLLAAEANAARKRASWAQDHLDLMGLSKP